MFNFDYAHANRGESGFLPHPARFELHLRTFWEISHFPLLPLCSIRAFYRLARIHFLPLD